MKKTVLSLATVVAASFLAMAADCSGSNVVECTVDNEAEVCGADEVCEFAEGETTGQCVLFDPTCDVDSDCDLASSDSPSYEAECTEDSDCDDAEGGEVCVANGVGATYCVLGDSDAEGEGCEELELGFVVATIDGKDVCVTDVNQSCDDAGQCVAN